LEKKKHGWKKGGMTSDRDPRRIKIECEREIDWTDGFQKGKESTSLWWIGKFTSGVAPLGGDRREAGSGRNVSKTSTEDLKEVRSLRRPLALSGKTPNGQNLNNKPPIKVEYERKS